MITIKKKSKLCCLEVKMPYMDSNEINALGILLLQNSETLFRCSQSGDMDYNIWMFKVHVRTAPFKKGSASIDPYIIQGCHSIVIYSCSWSLVLVNQVHIVKLYTTRAIGLES